MRPFLSARKVGPVLALFLSTFAASAQDSTKPCTCKNLESLQQDYQNAIYLEASFNKLAAELRRYEAADLKNGTSRSDTDAFGDRFYLDAVKVITDGIPFVIAGYKGPASVRMLVGTCEQNQDMLDALSRGSVCIGMADASEMHESEHRQLCRSMGAEAYWSRISSDIAAEEAGRYKNQAATLKAELQRVLDVSDVRLRGEWMHTLSGQGVEIVYFYTFDSGKMTTAEKREGSWTLKGTGTTSNEVVSMKAPGLSCKSSGAVKNEMVVTMATDGLTFDLELTEKNSGTNLQLICNKGMGFPIPTGEASSGQFVAGLPLKTGDTPVANAWADQIKALAASEGMSVAGDPSTSLSVTCEAP